jgi:hypothetical protein
MASHERYHRSRREGRASQDLNPITPQRDIGAIASVTTVPGLPDRDARKRLSSQAAHTARSLVAAQAAQRRAFTHVPTIPELAARIRKRAAYTGPSSAAVIREGRERR